MWDERIRPLPGNIVIYPSVKSALESSSWDWILAHNANDLLDSRSIFLPKVFLVHGTLSGRILQDQSNIDGERYLKNLALLLNSYSCHVVYISELKKRDWGIPGKVIRTAINPADYGGYRGNVPGILTVGNYLKERGAMLGWEAHRTICRKLPYALVGVNPGLAGSRVAESWEELKESYRSYRIYLHTAQYPYEDGYNLAVLEAMATGMPVATLSHPTTPIKNSIEGIVGSSPEELRRRIIRLLHDPDQAMRMGRAARHKLESEFPYSKFKMDWESLAAQVCKTGLGI
jgi:glycosyltransferase involved in cell wall biosynthesis